MSTEPSIEVETITFDATQPDRVVYVHFLDNGMVRIEMDRREERPDDHHEWYVVEQIYTFNPREIGSRWYGGDNKITITLYKKDRTKVDIHLICRSSARAPEISSLIMKAKNYRVDGSYSL